MSADLSRHSGATIVITGWLYAAPERRQTASGADVADLKVIVAGREGYTWYKVALFGRAVGDLDGADVDTGTLVQAAGSFEQTWWTDRDGKRRSSLSVTAQRVIVLSRPNPKIIEQITSEQRAARGDQGAGRGGFDDVPF